MWQSFWVELWWQNWSPSSPRAVRATPLTSPVRCQEIWRIPGTLRAGHVKLSVFTPAAPVFLYPCERLGWEREAPAFLDGREGYVFIHSGNTCEEELHGTTSPCWERKCWREEGLEEHAWLLISSTWRKWLFHVKCVFPRVSVLYRWWWISSCTPPFSASFFLSLQGRKTANMTPGEGGALILSAVILFFLQFLVIFNLLSPP